MLWRFRLIKLFTLYFLFWAYEYAPHKKNRSVHMVQYFSFVFNYLEPEWNHEKSR